MGWCRRVVRLQVCGSASGQRPQADRVRSDGQITARDIHYRQPRNQIYTPPRSLPTGASIERSKLRLLLLRGGLQQPPRVSTSPSGQQAMAGWMVDERMACARTASARALASSLAMVACQSWLSARSPRATSPTTVGTCRNERRQTTRGFAPLAHLGTLSRRRRHRARAAPAASRPPTPGRAPSRRPLR